MSRSKPKLRAGTGRDPWECGCRPARRRELGDKARSCQAGVPCPPAGDHDRDYARGEGHPPGHVQRTAAAVTDAELATYVARSAQGSRGAPHSGSLWGLRRNRGLHAESQRRFYGYLFSTDSNCRSLLTAPSRTRTLLPEGNNKAFSIQQRQRRQKAAILGPGTLRAEARMCSR